MWQRQLWGESSLISPTFPSFHFPLFPFLPLATPFFGWVGRWGGRAWPGGRRGRRGVPAGSLGGCVGAGGETAM